MASDSSAQIAITLPDGSVRQYARGVTGGEIAASIGPGLAKAAVAVQIDGTEKDLTRPINHDAKIAILTRDAPEAVEIIRHDAAHVMAEAVKELYPETQVTFGPSTDTGFYYDFARATPFTPEDLAKIEMRMHEIVDRDEKITREEWERDRAVEFFAELGEKYKAEWVHEIPKDEVISLYRQGNFVDLCRPVTHLPSTGKEAWPCLQADEGRRRLLARRRAQCAAPACLRHGLGERQRAEAISFPARRGGEARSSSLGPRARSFSSTGRSGRRGVLASERLDAVPHDRELCSPAHRSCGLCRSADAAARRPLALGSCRATGEKFREQMFVAQSRDEEFSGRVLAMKPIR